MDEKDVKTIGIALLADPVFCARIEELISRMKGELQKDFPLDSLPKHISLKQSFLCKCDPHALEAYLQSFFKALPPITVNTKKVQVIFTEGGRNVLVWVRIKENLRLRLVHFRLLLGLKKRFGVRPSGYDGFRWVFHSTVLYDVTDKQTARELKEHFDNMPYKTDIRPAFGVIFFCAGNAENPTEYCMGKLLPLRTNFTNTPRGLY